MDCDISQADLLRTADELYRRMEQPHFGSDDAYWSSLPVHLRNFIRNALPLAGNLAVLGNGSGTLPGGVLGAGGQRAMYALAQSIVGAANEGMGGSPDAATLMPPPPSVPTGAKSRSPSYQADGQNTGSDASHEAMVNNQYAVNADSRKASRRGSEANQQQRAVDPKATANDWRHDSVEADPIQRHHQPPIPRRSASPKASVPRTNHGVPNAVSPAVNYQPATHQQPTPAQNGAARQVQQPMPTNTPSPRAAGKQPMQAPGSHPHNPAQSQQQAGVPARSARSAGKAPVTSSSASPLAHHSSHANHGHPNTSSGHPKATAAGTGAAGKSKGGAPPPPAPPRVWQTSTAEEREKIRDFWNGLNKEGRRKLVKVEQDAILKKMRDYQRHSCSCAVCGRKRVAIEGELEVMYGQYANELDVYDARFNSVLQDGTLTPGSQTAGAGPGPFPGSVEVDQTGNVLQPDYLAPVHTHPSNRNMLDHPNDPNLLDSDEEYEDEDEEYDDDEDDDGDVGDDDEDEDDDELLGSGHGNDLDAVDDDHHHTHSHHHRSHRYDSAYDRRPSDGKYQAVGNDMDKTADKAAMRSGGPDGIRDFFAFKGELASIKGVLTVADDLLKNDGQRFLEMMEQLAENRQVGPEEEGDYESDDGLDGDSEFSTSVKAEEGRRVFQIFAARTFEQRVLQAYREQMAQQKQLQFLKELEEEENAAADREARKAKDAQKKKDKKKLQKQAKEDEKAKKEALAAAAEAEKARAKQAQIEKEAARRREEERLKKEAEKKAKAEEQAKREEEKRKKQLEAEKAKKLKEKEERAKAAKVASAAVPEAPKPGKAASSTAQETKAAAAERRQAEAAKAKALQAEREREKKAAVEAQAAARLAAQQRAAAAKSAVIAEQLAKSRKTKSSGQVSQGKQSSVGSNGADSMVASRNETSQPPKASSKASSAKPSPRTTPAPPPRLPVASSPTSAIVQDEASPPFRKAPVQQSPVQEQKHVAAQMSLPPGLSTGSQMSSLRSPSFESMEPSATLSRTLASGSREDQVSQGSFSRVPMSMSQTPSAGVPSGSMRDHGGRFPGDVMYMPTPNSDPRFASMTSPLVKPPMPHTSQHTTPILTATLPDFRPAASLRHEPIGPIQPIGRPRPHAPGDVSHESNAPGLPRKANLAPPPVGQVLGSAALSSGDDEVIMPAPRRVSHTAAAPGQTWGPAGSNMSAPSWNGPAFGGSPSSIWGQAPLPPTTQPGHTWAASPGGPPFGHPRFDSGSLANAAPGGFPLRGGQADSSARGATSPSYVNGS